MPSLPPSPDPYYSDSQITLHHGDSLAVLKTLPDASVDCCVTSPPYFGLRDYGVEGQYGLEVSPAEYVETMRALFAELRRVLADDGTLWLNIGDSYNNFRVSQRGQSVHGMEQRDKPTGRRPCDRTLKEKDLMGVPWRTASALQRDGWTLRNDIIWAKPNGMPAGSVIDRFASKHEHIFMFSKSLKYWFDLTDARGEGVVGDVWTVPTQPSPGTHFAVMPQIIAERAILAGCKPGGVVLDPFSGSGTTGLAATKHGRKYVGIDLSSAYLDLSLRTRFAQPGLDLMGESA